MFYHRRLINHFLHINQWLAQNNGQADLNMRTFQVRLTAFEKEIVLEPQFLLEKGATIAYTAALSPDVNGFIGWLPYRNKRWPLAINKILFKQYVEQSGKRTPQYWLTSERLPENALIKPAIGSFGNGQRGPFRVINPLNSSHELAPGEYYEKFRTGSILKAWYWNEAPICIELRQPLFVEGDGEKTVAALVTDRYQPSGKALERYEARKDRLAALLAYQSTSWEAVPAEGTRVLVDYLYGSSLYPELSHNVNQLNAVNNTPLGQELQDCGRIFYRAIPEEIRTNTAYAMDGIIDDATGEVRWLEMNSNPMFPPDAYATILDSLFKQ